MINMERFVFIIVVAFMSLPCLAQRDIKTFDHMSPEDVIALYGTPLRAEEYSSDYEEYIVFYNHSRFYFCPVRDLNGREYYSLLGFETDSPQFRVLSDYIEGGVKVGDSLTRLQSIDFQHSPYGRNKAANALKPTSRYLIMDSYKSSYVAFEEQYCFLTFCVENGIIKAFALYAKADNPNPNESYIPIW